MKSGKTEAYIHATEKDLNNFISAILTIADEVFDRLPGRKEKDVDLDSLFKHIVKTHWDEPR